MGYVGIGENDMISCPDFLGTELEKYVERAETGYGYCLKNNVPKEIETVLKKQIISYNNSVLRQAKAHGFGKYIKITKDGTIYLDKSAPKTIVDMFNGNE
ncbi:MAG: hypothetical protein ACI4KR_00760 [Ruminiclostridium sp.]